MHYLVIFCAKQILVFFSQQAVNYVFDRSFSLISKNEQSHSKVLFKYVRHEEKKFKQIIACLFLQENNMLFKGFDFLFKELFAEAKIMDIHFPSASRDQPNIKTRVYILVSQ